MTDIKEAQGLEVVAWRIGFPNGAGYKVYEQHQPWAYEQYGRPPFVTYEVQDLVRKSDADARDAMRLERIAELEAALLDTSVERNAMQRDRDQYKSLLGRECDDADAILAELGIPDDEMRTEGGSLMVAHVTSTIKITIQQLRERVSELEYAAELDRTADLYAQQSAPAVVGWYQPDAPLHITANPQICANWHREGLRVAPVFAATPKAEQPPVQEPALMGKYQFEIEWPDGGRSVAHGNITGEQFKQVWAILFPEPEKPAHDVASVPLVIAGALFDFGGYLTTREKVIEVGATANASPMVDLIKEFADMRGLSLTDAAVLSWSELLPLAAAPQPVALVCDECGGNGAGGDHEEDCSKAPQPVAQQKVVMPECSYYDSDWSFGWNACLDEFERLNGGKP